MAAVSDPGQKKYDKTSLILSIDSTQTPGLCFCVMLKNLTAPWHQ